MSFLDAPGVTAAGLDSAIQERIADPESAARGELNATYAGKSDVVPKWKANTAYASGAAVLNPFGDVVTAKAAFTSGSAYDPTKWKLSTNYAQSGTRPAKPLIVFTFDDSPYTDKSIIMPLLTSKDIKATFGVLTNVVSLFPTSDTQLTYVDLKAWEDAGHEIASHSVSHVNMVDATTATAETEIGGAYNLLKSKGLDPQGLIWPHSLSSAAARTVARKYHTYGLGGAGSYVQPFGTMQVERWGFGNTRTLVETQARIDQCVANSEMLVILVHSGSDLDAAHQTMLGQVIDYAKASAAQIVTARQAFDMVGNLYETGDYPGGAYTVIGGQGKLLLSPSLITAGPGDINSKIVANWFYGPMNGALSNAVPPLNTAHAHPLIISDPLGLTIQQVNITVATAGSADSVVRVGVYADSNGLPGALIQELGTFATATTGSKAITGLNRKLVPGKYWVASVAQGTTAASLGCSTGISPYVANVGGTSGHVAAYTQNGVTGALPANYGTPVGTNFAVIAALRAL
ncbi:glucosaminyl deacetylase [Arthrobacter phage EvePickles]|nr:glucosaminyl deacetylase [Arthrobacter phage EvePickles]